MSGRWNYSQNDMNTFLVDFIDDKEVINTFPDLHKIVKRITLTLIKIFDDIDDYLGAYEPIENLSLYQDIYIKILKFAFLDDQEEREFAYGSIYETIRKESIRLKKVLSELKKDKFDDKISIIKNTIDFLDGCTNTLNTVNNQ